ncbi:MAG: hypothetical protein U1F15_03700 [Burkholderiales bacterium]
MRVTLAVPNLLAVDRAALSAVPALARLAAYAAAPETEPAGLATAVIVAAGGARAAAVAPLAAQGAGLSSADPWVAHADPVALVAGRDDVLLEGRIDDLARADADAMIGTLNAHFAADGVAFHAPRPDAWFVTGTAFAPPAATPLPLVHGAIAAHLPHGEHAGLWLRWLSEMQMLLHEHPVNAERERAGRRPVSGLWVWGGGETQPTPTTINAAIHAPPGRAGDVARGLALRSGNAFAGTPARLVTLSAEVDSLVVLPPVTGAEDLAALDAAWLTPAVKALEDRVVAQFVLIADGRGPAFAWTARAPTWRQRLRARFAPRAFAPPAGDGKE